MLVRRIVSGHCTTLIGDPWTGSSKTWRSENDQLLVGFRLIRSGIHSLPGAGLTTTTSAQYKDAPTGGRLSPLLLSCGDSIRGNGNGGLDNESLVR